MGVRRDIDSSPGGDIKALKGLRISTSFAFPRTALRHMLIQAGMDVDHDEVRGIVAKVCPRRHRHTVSMASEALQENLADGFWGER